MSISRRKLFAGAAAVAATPIMPASAAPKTKKGMEVVATFDKPVQAMTIYRGNLIVAVDNKIFFYNRQNPARWDSE